MTTDFSQRLKSLTDDDLLRTVRDVEAAGPGRRTVGGRVLLDFASNDYLGLSRHPAVVGAAVTAAETDGVGSTASASVVRSEPQRRLEEELATFEGTEAALVFPTGYAANVGVISAVAGDGDVVFCERENHACVVDGCRSSGAGFRVFRRKNLDRLDGELAKFGDRASRFVAVDGVYSMDGTTAPLSALVEICERRDATLIVDEAHGSGVLGANGRGACEAAGVGSDRVIRTGTLSKAFGCQGGFVCGPRAMIEWLRNAARTQMFSTALAHPVAAAAETAVRLVREGAVRWDESLARPLRAAAAQAVGQPAGWADAEGPIVAVFVGPKSAAVRTSSAMEDAGVLVAGIRPPTVPRRTSRLRLTVSMAHSPEDVEAAAKALRAVIRSEERR